MLAAIRGTPTYFAAGIRFADDIGGRLPAVERVIVAGMGGSAFPADLLALADSLNVEVVSNRDYDLRAARPRASDLVIACSYSGDTEETLSVFAEALSARQPLVTISAGGALAERARLNDVPHVLLDRPTPAFQPRAATGFFLGALAAILEDAGVMPGGRAEMQSAAAFLASLEDVEARAEALASRLAGRIPVIYAPPPWAESAARICKIKLNENAKQPAFYNAWPELNHNEMVGFTRAASDFIPVLLVPSPLAPAMARRVAVSAETFEAHGLAVERVDLVGETALQQALGAVLLFDFASCRLAELAGIDPNPVDMIEEFKRRLKLASAP